jgi:hypothetical protein
MRKAASFSLTAVLAGLTALFALTWRNRAALPYNSEGRFFDASDSVVYHDSSVVSYAVMTLFFAAMTAVSAYRMARTWRR